LDVSGLAGPTAVAMVIRVFAVCVMGPAFVLLGRSVGVQTELTDAGALRYPAGKAATRAMLSLSKERRQRRMRAGKQIRAILLALDAAAAFGFA
jgi:hypothetical protein